MLCAALTLRQDFSAAPMNLSDDLSSTKYSLMRALLENHDFFHEFYDRFFASSPEIPKMFADTDFRKQRELIRQGIELMISYAEGHDWARDKLLKIAVIHKRFGLTREMYDLWRTSLLKTLEKNDPDYSAPLEGAWNQVLSQGIEFFLEHGS